MKNLVKAYRTKKGLTQAELAARLDVTRQTVNSIERGKYLPRLPLALNIGRALGAPVEELFQTSEG